MAVPTIDESSAASSIPVAAATVSTANRARDLTTAPDYTRTRRDGPPERRLWLSRAAFELVLSIGVELLAQAHDLRIILVHAVAEGLDDAEREPGAGHQQVGHRLGREVQHRGVSD